MTLNTDVGKSILTKATALIPMLRKRGFEIDSLGCLPDDIVKAMGNAGIWQMIAPPEYGGHASLSARDTYDIIVEIAKGNSSAAWGAVINLITASLIDDFPETAIREFFDQSHNGPFAGASIFNLSHAEGEARAVEGGFMVKGRWSFSSNILNAAYEIGGTNLLDAQGNPVERLHVMIPRHQLKIADDWKVSGMKGTGSNTAYIDEEIFVPAYRTANVSQILREALNSGQLQDPSPAGPLAATGTALSAIAIGGAYGALDVFIEKARTRKPWGQPYPTILEVPSTQVVVAKMLAQINMCEAAMQRAADRIDTGARGAKHLSSCNNELSDPYYDAIYVISCMRDAIADLQNIMGSSTASVADTLGRFATDIRVMSLHGGLRLDWWSESHGRKILGLPPLEGINLDTEGAQMPGKA